jgi:hypothetical protein
VEDGISFAHVELGRGALRVHATSPRRLGAAQQMVEALLGGDIERAPAP